MTPVYPVQLVLPEGERKISVPADRFIWQVAGEAGIALPSRCRIGWCLTCAARLLEPGDFDNSAARRYFPQDREAGFILPCTARPRSPLRLLTHQADAMRHYRQTLGLPAPLA
jgi:ferredoxin